MFRTVALGVGGSPAWSGTRPIHSRAASQLTGVARAAFVACALHEAFGAMAVAVSSDARVDVDDHPLLPLPFTTVLIVELAVLGTLVAVFGTHPPLAHESGWAGAGSMIAMQLYSVRRRVRALRNLGSLRTWLDAHIFLGFQGFVLVAYHSVGISPNADLAAVNFALVSIVVLTGVIGRYLYGFIPRARAGRAISYGQLSEALGAMALPITLRRECRGLIDLIVLDIARRRALGQVGGFPAVAPGLARLLGRSITLASSISTLEVADRWFSRWTLLHRPLAILLLGITTLHVLAHFAYAT